jgi:plastocyanin
MSKLFGSSLMVSVSAALAVVVFASPASGGSDADSNTHASKGTSVSVRDDVFSPRSLTVARGAKVTWRWRGQNPHNVKFRKVPSGASKRGTGTKTSGRFSRTFSKSGRYRYVCTIHESLGMKGSVSVK